MDDPGHTYGLPPAKAADSRAPAPFRGASLRARLLVTIPALMAVFSIAIGVLCYQVILTFDAVNPPPARFPVDRAASWVLGIIIFGSLLAAVSGYVLALTILGPIRQFETQLAKFATTGRVEGLSDNPRVAPELGQLGQKFDDALRTLSDYVSQRNHYILECFTGALILLDADGSVMSMNSAAEQMLGPASRGLAGRSLEDWLRSVDPDSSAADVLRVAREDGVYADSRELQIEVPYQGRFPALMTVSPLPGVRGAEQGYSVNFRDLRKYRQFAKYMDRADRLAAVGTFATGIAHEIRNPLGSVKGMAQLLAEEQEEDTPAREYADVIVREANRLDKVVRSLLDFARPNVAAPEAIDLNRALAESLMLAKNAAEMEHLETLDIREDYRALPPVWAERDRMIQALVNIVRNAFEAAPPGGCVRLSTNRARTDDDVDVCEARISNTGDPIPEEDRVRVFEPFYSTKRGGTGLGLAIVSQIVLTNGGDIAVECADGWTTFIVRFPAHP